MKKISVTVQYDEEKLNTLKLFLEKKNVNINDEIVKYIDILYTKNVPAAVRDFFEMKSGAEKPSSNSKPKPKEKETPTNEQKTNKTS